MDGASILMRFLPGERQEPVRFLSIHKAIRRAPLFREISLLGYVILRGCMICRSLQMKSTVGFILMGMLRQAGD